MVHGLTRQAAREGRVPRQAAALTEEGLATIRATAQLLRTGPSRRIERARIARRPGRVDIALASVMRDAMLRRSKAVALRWADVDFRPRRIRPRHRPPLEGRLGRRGRHAVHREGSGGSASDPSSRCPAGRLGLRVSGRCGVEPDGAGCEGGEVGGPVLGTLASGRHGPRPTYLVASGEGLAAVQVAGSWNSTQMPAHYARGELASKGAVARFHREDYTLKTLNGGSRTVADLATVGNTRPLPQRACTYVPGAPGAPL